MKVISKNKSSDLLYDSNFIESYYKELNRKTKDAVNSQAKWLRTASSYISDGMDEKECAELLSIDGLPKEIAGRYAHMAMDTKDQDGDIYSFDFENIYGEVIASAETKRYITAASEEDAWLQAQQIIENEMQEFEPDHIVSIKLAK